MVICGLFKKQKITLKDGLKKHLKNIKKKTSKKISKKISKKTFSKKYLIHDNGGRPFQVVINNNIISVYKKFDNNTYDELLLNEKVIKVHIGKDSNNKNWNGNTILLQLSENKFICISNNIFKFELEKDDIFVKYFSMIGNSDVPYPVLLSENNFYSMVDKTYCPKTLFLADYKINDFEDSHSYYYTNIYKQKISKNIYKLPKLQFIYK